MLTSHCINPGGLKVALIEEHVPAAAGALVTIRTEAMSALATFFLVIGVPSRNGPLRIDLAFGVRDSLVKR